MLDQSTSQDVQIIAPIQNHHFGSLCGCLPGHICCLIFVVIIITFIIIIRQEVYIPQCIKCRGWHNLSENPKVETSDNNNYNKKNY